MTTDATQETQETPPSQESPFGQDLKIVIHLKPPNAMIGVSQAGKDPHVVSLEMHGDALDLLDVLHQVPQIVNTALARFGAVPQYPRYERPTPPAPAPRVGAATRARAQPKPQPKPSPKPGLF